MFLKAVFETLKWCVLVGLAVFLLAVNGISVFPNDLNNYYSYVVLFLFFLTAVMSAMY